MLHVPLLWLGERQNERERIGENERESERGRGEGGRSAGSALCKGRRRRKEERRKEVKGVCSIYLEFNERRKQCGKGKKCMLGEDNTVLSFSFFTISTGPYGGAPLKTKGSLKQSSKVPIIYVTVTMTHSESSMKMCTSNIFE